MLVAACNWFKAKNGNNLPYQGGPATYLTTYFLNKYKHMKNFQKHSMYAASCSYISCADFHFVSHFVLFSARVVLFTSL